MRYDSVIPSIQEYIGVKAIDTRAIMKMKIGRMAARISIVIVIFLFAGIALNKYVLSPSHVLTLDGQKRTFTIYTPSKSFMKSHRDIPVLFVLHGNPSYSWQIQLYTGMSEVAREKNFIVVYPDASKQRWPYENERDIENEVNYISGLIDFIKSEYPIDTNRIYMSGISGGGIFSIILANRIPDQIAALAVVAGNVPKSISITESIPPKPTMLIHGTEDFIYNGRDDLYSAVESIRIWSTANGCAPDNTLLEANLNNVYSAVEGVEINQFKCSRAPLLFYKINNGGHHWPGARFNADHFSNLNLGNFNRELNASVAIWDFVSQHAIVND